MLSFGTVKCVESSFFFFPISKPFNSTLYTPAFVLLTLSGTTLHRFLRRHCRHHPRQRRHSRRRRHHLGRLINQRLNLRRVKSIPSSHTLILSLPDFVPSSSYFYFLSFLLPLLLPLAFLYFL